MSRGRATRFLAVLVVLAACDEPPAAVGPEVSRPSAEASGPFLALAQDVPPAEVDLPPQGSRWYEDGAALVERVKNAEGRAVVGFKNPGAVRILAKSGRVATREAISAGDARAGLALLHAIGVEVRSFRPAAAQASVVLDPQQTARLLDNPRIDYIEPLQVARLDMARRSARRVPFAQSTPWGIHAVGAPQSWSDVTGFGASILVIDTGHDKDHADLPSVSFANCGGPYSGCSDDGVYHGTGVLGVATARNNGIGVVGVAPGVTPSNTYVWGACNHLTGKCLPDTVANGLQAGIDWEVDVVNMSLSVDSFDLGLANMIASVDAAGIVMVASAGNHCHHNPACPSNEARYPVLDSKVIGVSGVNANLSFAHPSSNGTCDAWSSNFGIHVDLSAAFDANTTDDGGYTVMCGTSFAAPHVTGVVALVRAMAPSLTPFHVRQRLYGTARDLGASGWDQYFGYGLVDAYAATGPHVSIDGPTEIPPNQTCEWLAPNIPGGFGSLSYKWYKGPTLVGTGSTYSTSATSNFQLQLIITDGQNISREHHFTVSVDQGHDECDW